jgi:hypothetical protein
MPAGRWSAQAAAQSTKCHLVGDTFERTSRVPAIEQAMGCSPLQLLPAGRCKHALAGSLDIFYAAVGADMLRYIGDGVEGMISASCAQGSKEGNDAGRVKAPWQG